MQRDIRSLDLNLLKALDALLDERSVTRAAARLSLTQPAVSGMLTRLREAFGDPLFVRAQRGIVPTTRALELARPVKSMLEEIERLLQPDGFDPATATLTVSIAATDYALRTLIVPFLAALRVQAPGIRLAVHPVDDLQVNAALETGTLDMAILTPETTSPGLHSHPLYDEQYVCALRHDHPALADGTLTLEHFCALEHAMVSYAGGGFRGVTDEALARIGRERRVTVSVTSFLVLPEILRESDLISVVPKRLIKPSEGLTLVSPPLDITGFSKVLAWHERTHRDAARIWLRTLLTQSL
ncbi:LysR family transcriptional regulator [Pseudomonas sp. NPDC089734]|uniref:LysR family transcriptional regulator n=1 Tax=Pseudomonas sp. NPDC089734 TaxID=3364469 RepID=UPI00382D1A77